MPKRSSKPSTGDVNENAARIVRLVTDTEPAPPSAPAREKDPAAVSLGRRGGLKGGKERAARLTPERRAEIARDAASARWGKKNGDR